METLSLARRLARYALSLRFEDLPAATVHEAKRRFIDSLGCALGALSSEPGRIARRLAATASARPGATVLGTGRASSPEWAAFSNGVHIRFLDFNDTYLSREPAHPSDNLAAVMAAGELVRAGGRELLAAAVLAYEVQCRLCDAASIRARGWDHVTYGAFSTVLAAGRLLGLSEEQLAHAVGIAGTHSAALRQTRVGELSMWKGCAFAATARNGLFAARLAGAGMTGPAPLFEGEMGFWKQVSGEFDLDVDSFGGEGRPFMIHRTCIKRHPAEYHAQSAIDAALQLREELLGHAPSAQASAIVPPAARGASPEPEALDIAAVTVESFDAAVDIIGGEAEKWRPRSRETADHSLPYCVAVALADGRVWLEQFQESRFTDERLLDLVAKVSVVRRPELTARYPEGIPNRVTVQTVDGRSVTREVTWPRGHARNPMTDQEVEAKFRALAGPFLPGPRVAEALDRLWNLEREGDVGGLLGLLAAPHAETDAGPA